MNALNAVADLTRDQRAKRRQAAIDEMKEGKSQADVARQFKVSRNAVSKWWKAFQDEGEKSFQARYSPGRPQRLNSEQKRRLRKMLLQGPKAQGWKTDLWTTARIAALIKRQFGVSYHRDHVGRILHQLGFSWQKPQRKAAQRNEEEIRRWLAEEWPRIKKN